MEEQLREFMIFDFELEQNDVGKKRSSTPDVLKTRVLRSSPSELSKELSSENESHRSHMSDQSPMVN